MEENIKNVVRRVVMEMGLAQTPNSAPSASSSTSSSTNTALGVTGGGTPRPPAPAPAHGRGSLAQDEAAVGVGVAVPPAAALNRHSPHLTVHAQSSDWPTPSIARRSRGRGRSSSSRIPVRRLVSKDIICMPYTESQFLPIPRGKARQKLAEAGYAGKITLWRGQTPQEVIDEVSSVFEGLAEGSALEFEFLSILPGRGKKLQRPKVSQHFQWGGTEVLAGQGQGSMYVMMAPQYGLTYEDFFVEDDDPDRKRQRCESEEESSEDEVRIVVPHTTPRERRSLSLDAGRAQPARLTPQTSSDVSSSYEAYVELVEVEFAENDGIPVHAAANFEEVVDEYVPDTLHKNEELFQADLDAWKDKQVTRDGPPNHLYVRRKHLLADALGGFRDGALKADCELSVHFVGETAIDTGGPTRELFCLILPKIRDSGMFFGCHGRMLPAKNSAGITNGAIKKVGMVLGAAILHGRMRLDFINPLIGHLLCEGEPSNLAINLLPEIAVQELITRVIQAIVFHQLVNRQKGELDALIEGMNYWGTKNFAEAHPACIHAVFHTRKIVDPNEIFGLFTFEYSEEGSNAKEEEEKTTMFFIEFLQKCDSKDPEVEGLTLEDFLQFFCGARCIPLGGFDMVPTIKFHNNMLPHVSTCSLELQINRKCAGAEAFIKDMVFGLKNAPGFGQV